MPMMLIGPAAGECRFERSGASPPGIEKVIQCLTNHSSRPGARDKG